MTKNLRAFHAIISGDVQMVGFRAFAERQAYLLGIQGFVRNLPDGTVEVEAEGEEPALKDFLESLRQGPRAGRVDSVSISWRETKGQYHDFRTRH
jgi:acylphosphatase